MSKKAFIVLIFLGSTVLANSLNLKLPGKEGENFIITRGYGTVTHRGVDSFALDFALDKCRTFGQPILATEKGTVVRMENWHKRGEKNSYGNMVVIDHSENIFSLYGHMNTVNVKVGDTVRQGEQIGTIGNTGSCEGTACHPYEGAHLHFAMYQKEKYVTIDGKAKERLIPYKPEPMSGFSVFVAGKYYKSDNGLPEETEDNTVELASKTVEQKSKEDDFCLISAIINKFDITLKKEDHTATMFGIYDPSTFGVPKSDIDLGSIKTGLSGFRIDENGQIVRIENTVENGSVGAAAVEKKKELSFEEKYNAELGGREIAGCRRGEYGRCLASPGSEMAIGVNYKNTGAWDWSNKNVSLNIANPGMGIFYDNWLTGKRPVAVSQNLVKSGERGKFSFMIRVPTTLGVYKFGVKPVVFYENDFHWLGDDEAFWEIEVKPEDQNENASDIGADTADAGTSVAGDLGVGGNPDEAAEKSENQKDEKMEESKKNDKGKRTFGGSSGTTAEYGADAVIETYLSLFPLEHANKEQAVFSFNSNFSEAKFKCRMDAGDFSECASPSAYGSLAEGRHIFEVKAFVGSREDTTPASHSFEIDRTAPLEVRDLETDSPEKGSAHLSGTLPEDGLPKIKAYYKKSEDCSKEACENMETWSAKEILLEENVKEKSGSRFELSFKGLEEGENYCFAVKTEDLAGNVSEFSNIAGIIINNSANHVLISEIKLHGEDRFIELYNPTSGDVDLSGHSLQLLEDGADKTVKIDFAAGSKISSHGFFLAADGNSFKDLVPDLSCALPQLSGKAAVYLAKTADYLLDKESGIENLDNAAAVDEIEIAPLESADWSLERKAHPNSTSELMLAVPHKYDGNGYDSDVPDDFVFRHVPQPQNSAGIKEPHRSQKPDIKTPDWNGKKYFTGEEINLKIEVADIEDGNVAGNSIVWYMDGQEAGRGAEISMTKLVAGKYDLLIEADDSDGEKTLATFSIEVANNGWSGAVEIPGTDTWIYGAAMDGQGILHIAYFQQSWDGEGNCINSIYYRKKEGDSFSEPVEVIRIGGTDCYFMDTINLEADDRGVIHIFYVGQGYNESYYHAYYANSSDNFKQITPVFQDVRDIYDAKFQVEGENVYITAVDDAGGIYYKKFSVSGSSIQLVRQSFYKMDAARIISYDFSVKDGRLYFVVLHRKENADYVPRQFTEGLPINPAYYVYKDSWIGYLEVADADWSFDLVDGKFYHDALVHIQGGSPSYVLVNDSTDGASFMFAKWNDTWYRNDLDIEWEDENNESVIGWESVFGFGQNADNKFHLTSLSRNYDSHGVITSHIFWNLYDGNSLRKINVLHESGRDVNLDNIIYVHNASGKEGILFSYSTAGENEMHKVYYLERNGIN